MAPPSGAADHGAKSVTKQSAPPEQKTITIIDGSNGARHDVVISPEVGDHAESGAVAGAMAGVDQRLLEKSRYGMIPVMSEGLKPFMLYAAESDRGKAATMPVVSIVIAGLGVGAA